MATVQNFDVVSNTFDVEKVCILVRIYSSEYLSRWFPLLKNIKVIIIVIIIKIMIFNTFQTASSNQ
jgi:hypothetical protein